ncbi:MAG: elongation factor G [candidate division WOR-3 bacterium]|nr:elongation factor G [candidate division WOR-3 bacterium]MCX7757073.1 elongation factor G [candidate division WOR-3 bacterium]MDW7987579.1 elongation factor G [candidate division WOR-3 bacterium]
MKQYPPEKIINIGFFGHGGCGKTTLGEGILYILKENNRIGRVDEGSSIFNYDEDEIARKISINLALGYGDYQGYYFNLVDTPGYQDFIGEVLSGLRAIDSAVLVIDATAGIEVGTEIVWRHLNQEGLPRIIFINKLKKEHADFYKVLDEIISEWGSGVCPLYLPIGKEASFEGVYSIIEDKAYRYKNGTREEITPPAELQERGRGYKEKIIEAACEVSEEIMAKYLEGEDVSFDELAAAIKEGIKAHKIFPVLCGDAYELIGLYELLDFATKTLSGLAVSRKIKAINLKTKELEEIIPAENGPTIVFVFKTVSEPHIGDMNYVRVFSGTLEAGKTMLNATVEREEKINQIYYVKGKERIETNKLRVGEIGALVKLKQTKTSDTLTTSDAPYKLEPIKFPEPSISIAIVPKTKGDEEKVSNGLARLHEEDPTFTYYYDNELKQQIISGLGELHLDIIIGRLKRKFDVSVDLEKPKIPYRETIVKKAEAQGKYKKQTGGRGQYGDVWLRIEPKERGTGFEFAEEIFGGAVPAKYFPSVEKGVVETMANGVLAGYPVVDVKVTLFDGSYHEVDSSDIAFKIAASMAFKAACEKAGMVILEPIYDVEVRVPEQYTGDIMGDLNARRGKILGIEAEGKLQVIKAKVPLAEMYKYSNTLRSITQGRGYFTMRFSHYEEAPRELQAKIIEEAKRQKESQENK